MRLKNESNIALNVHFLEYIVFIINGYFDYSNKNVRLTEAHEVWPTQQFKEIGQFSHVEFNEFNFQETNGAFTYKLQPYFVKYTKL